MKAKYVNRSFCECGFPVLKDEIPLEEVYEIDPEYVMTGTFTCGGCAKVIPIVMVMAEAKIKGPPSWLPAAIFELPDGFIYKALLTLGAQGVATADLVIRFPQPEPQPSGFPMVLRPKNPEGQSHARRRIPRRSSS